MTIFNIRNVLWTLAALVKLAIVAGSLSAEEVRTPDHLYASVRITNPGYASGSGTIISRGPEDGWSGGLTCDHLFVGKIGGQFIVDYPNGVRAKAILRRVSRSRELSLFFVPTKSVLEVANVPVRMPERAKYHVCGYPRTEGPKFYGLEPAEHSSVVFANGMQRWCFRTTDGEHYWQGDKLLDQHGAQIIGGNSGCGIFGNGQLVSVLSHNAAPLPGGASPVCYGAPHSQIVAFLNECSDEQKWCGNWFAEPASPAQAAPPPPPPEPERGPFKPKPNIPVDPRDENASDGSSGESNPITPGKDSQGYSGHGRPPKDLRGPRKRSAGIDELNGRVHRLEELLSHGVPPGEQGPPGEDGKDFTPPEKPPIKHDFTPLVIACLAAVGLGKFIGYKLGF